MNIKGLPFSYEELQEAVEQKRVYKRSNSDETLDIYNYSDEVQYTNKWDEVTLHCRGLVLDKQANIVARPWKKFFNLGQVNLPIQFNDPVEVMDKADGSLGILYRWNSEYRIATRGSFDSAQAWHATKVLKATYRQDFSNFDAVVDQYTFLFEIIYKANRIVLNYGDMDDLILLGAVEKDTGYYLSPTHAQSILGWNGPVVEVYEHKTISDALGAMGRDNKEGYVLRSHNFMVKIKEPDYLDLHRLVTNITPKNVWEQLKSGKSKHEIVSVFPDEFHDEVGGICDALILEYGNRLAGLDEKFNEYMCQYYSKHEEFDRKSFASLIKKDKDQGYMWLMVDERPVRDMLWKELRPKGDPADI